LRVHISQDYKLGLGLYQYYLFFKVYCFLLPTKARFLWCTEQFLEMDYLNGKKKVIEKIRTYDR
jgi:hypothetical protein